MRSEYLKKVHLISMSTNKEANFGRSKVYFLSKRDNAPRGSYVYNAGASYDGIYADSSHYPNKLKGWTRGKFAVKPFRSLRYKRKKK